MCVVAIQSFYRAARKTLSLWPRLIVQLADLSPPYDSDVHHVILHVTAALFFLEPIASYMAIRYTQTDWEKRLGSSKQS